MASRCPACLAVSSSAPAEGTGRAAVRAGERIAAKEGRGSLSACAAFLLDVNEWLTEYKIRLV
jgi:hypothetical protein